MSYEIKELKYKGKIIFQKLVAPTPNRSLKPFNENEACFMFVNRGDFSVRTPNSIFPFSQNGSGLLAKCFNFFVESTKDQRERQSHVELIGVYLYPEILEELFQIDLSLSSHKVDYNAKQVQINGLLNHFKESIIVLLDNPDLADDAIIKTKLKEFVLLISKTQNSPTQLDFLSALFKKNDTEFKTTIANNLYSNLSVDEFAQLCAMSVSTFKRKFKETYSLSPKKYIAQKKLDKAKSMLTDPNLRVSDIAYDCGFETISTFNRSFKTEFGASPSAYRLNLFA